jgi:hypothetical protein
MDPVGHNETAELLVWNSGKGDDTQFSVTPITLATCLSITRVKPRNIQSFTQKLLRTFHTVLWHQKGRCNSIMLD